MFFIYLDVFGKCPVNTKTKKYMQTLELASDYGAGHYFVILVGYRVIFSVNISVSGQQGPIYR